MFVTIDILGTEPGWLVGGVADIKHLEERDLRKEWYLFLQDGIRESVNQGICKMIEKRKDAGTQG